MGNYPDELRRFEPFWGYWRLDGLIGEGSYGKVYRIRREDFTRAYHAALKWIELPHSPQEISSLRSEGMTDPDIQSYFDDFARQLGQEIDLMSRLRGNSHIVSYEDHMLHRRTAALGWDIFIRMELLTSLTDHVLEGMTAADVMVMGMHLCNALMLLKQQNIIHRDIKPDNIFYATGGNYKLGDFGVARQLEKTSGSYSKRGTPYYMAPEVYRNEHYDAGADIYSLGLVMYRLLNRQQLPFLATTDHVPTQQERDIAFERRMRGDPLPLPQLGGKRLGEVVLKACAYAPSNRFATAEQFLWALSEIPQKGLEDIPVQAGRVAGQPSGRPTPQRSPVMPPPVAGARTPTPRAATPYPKAPRTKKRRWWVWGTAAVLLCALGTGALLKLTGPRAATQAAAPEETPLVVIYTAPPRHVETVVLMSRVKD